MNTEIEIDKKITHIKEKMNAQFSFIQNILQSDLNACKELTFRLKPKQINDPINETSPLIAHETGLSKDSIVLNKKIDDLISRNKELESIIMDLKNNLKNLGNEYEKTSAMTVPFIPMTQENPIPKIEKSLLKKNVKQRISILHFIKKLRKNIIFYKNHANQILKQNETQQIQIKKLNIELDHALEQAAELRDLSQMNKNI